MKFLHKITASSFFTSTLLLGASTPNVGTISKEINPPKNIQKDKKDLIEIEGIKNYEEPMKFSDTQEKVLINNFDIKGNTKLSIQEINTIIKKYENTQLSFYDMQIIASSITKLYRDKGYFVARAYIPVQDTSSGTLKVVIIEGEFGSINLENSSDVKDSVINGIFNNIKKESVISTKALERGLLIANDLPGVYVSQADVKAGSKIGTSDFDIKTSQKSKYQGYIIADNYGNRYSNKNRVMASATINSPFKIGDKLSVTGLQSEDAYLKYIDLNYNTLLSSNGLRGGFGYSYTSYKLGEEFAALEAKGYSKDINFNLSYPIIRQREKTLLVNFDFYNKKVKDDIDSTNTSSKKKINVANLSLDYTYSTLFNNLPSDTRLIGTLTYGNLSFYSNSDLSDDMAGANTNGTYKKFNLEAFKSIGITSKLSLEGSFKYQHSFSNKNLDGSEDLSIGGSQGVKVYPTSEVSAENGYVLSLEAKYTLPNINSYSHTIGVFFDKARAYSANNTNIIGEDINLQDAGISYYASYKDFFINSYMAWRVNSREITSEPDYNSKLLVQIGWVF